MSQGRLESRAWLESLAPVPLDGHEVLLLEGGREFFPALIEAIAGATRAVHLETYIFEDDPAGRAVARALAEAAGRGVETHVVVDGYGTPRLGGEAGATLRAAGVGIMVFRPEKRRLSLDRNRLRRLHRKLAVIDGRVAFVGGINLIDDCFDPNHGRLDEPRLDFAVRVRGPVVVSVQRATDRLWWELALVRSALGVVRGRRRALPALPKPGIGDAAPVGTMRAMLVLRDNFRFRRTIEHQYLRAIDAARREVLIANAYFFPGARFRSALVAAARRGVRVRLLLQGRVEYRLQHYATQALYDELLAAGVEIVEYRRSFLHAKVAVIDDLATVGSSNIDPFSLLLAREANLFVFDAAFAARLRARVERAIEDGGVHVQPSLHARRAWPVRALNGLAMLLLRLGVALSGERGGY